MGKHCRKGTIFILRIREHIHIHSFPISVGFFLSPEQISIFQPQNIYVQSQASKHSILCGRQIHTVLATFNLDFFPHLSAFTTLQSKYLKAGIKNGGNYNLLITYSICWHAILLYLVKQLYLLHQRAHFIWLDSFPMRLMLFETYAPRHIYTHLLRHLFHMTPWCVI